MENKEKKEIIPGYFAGDTVMLKRETDLTKSQHLKIGTIGVVSDEDTEETLEGWEVIDYERKFKEVLDEMDKEQISELFNRLVELGHIKKEDIEKSK